MLKNPRAKPNAVESSPDAENKNESGKPVDLGISQCRSLTSSRVEVRRDQASNPLLQA